MNIHNIFPEICTSLNTTDPVTGVVTTTDPEGHGIWMVTSGKLKDTYYNDVLVESCQFSYLYKYGLQLKRQQARNPGFEFHKNVVIRGNTFTHTGSSGFQTGYCDGVTVENNVTDDSGSSLDSRMFKYHGSGYWPWKCNNVLIQHNQFKNANGNIDSCGMHVDYGNTNITVQYNLSYNNAGGFIEILGDTNNITYRYNVSINDGWRTAGQASHLIWLSAYNYPTYIAPQNCRIYNNTIYVKAGLANHITIDSSSVNTYIANNVFIIAGITIYDPTAGTNPGKFNGNMWCGNWPSGLPQGAADILADPLVTNPGGITADDYKLTNYSPAIHTGAAIPDLAIGTLGTANDQDYWGTALPSAIPPCLGAHENTSNHPPVANAQSIGAVVNTSRGIMLTGSDPDSDALTYTVVVQPAHGSLSGTAPSLTYTPNTDYSGADSFTFKVTDSRGADSVSAAMVAINVAVNQPPVANAGPDQYLENFDGSGSQSVTLNGTGSSDTDGNIVSYVWKDGGTQIATGSMPTVALATGLHTMTLTVTDNNGAATSDTVIVTISPVSVILSHTFNGTGVLAGTALNIAPTGASTWKSNAAITADGAISLTGAAAVSASAYIDLGTTSAVKAGGGIFELEVVMDNTSSGGSNSQFLTAGFWVTDPGLNASHDNNAGCPWSYWRGSGAFEASTGKGYSGDILKGGTVAASGTYETFTYRLDLSNATLTSDSVKVYHGNSLLGSVNFSGDESFRYVGVGARTFDATQTASGVIQSIKLRQIVVPTGTNPVITASSGANGTIFPSGAVQVAPGLNQVFAITPAANYHIASVLVDGVEQGPGSSYTLNTVTTNHTIQAAFARDSPTPTVTTVPTASVITYGQALASSTLSGGVASVPGTFAWTTPSTMPAVGTAAQAATFTPTDTTNYATASLTVNVTTVTKFDAWASGYGLTGAAALTTADSDGDGIPNLVKYALGLNPTVANANPVQVSQVAVNGSTYLQLSVVRNPLVTNVTIEGLSAGALTDTNSWSTGTTVNVTNTSSVFTVRDSLPMENNARRFLRLRFTLQP